ncbi:SpoIID/LytB domain-containing protein [Myceligenerans crystallogenes]|uniref:Sporulation stage II protein D amidase enhancer LytB N-terminal domain-containing protein n=1 Tax=Myceligenerans crystallogenes TaxID=316335 RepID=A0ABN2NFN6_9MICO
MSTTTPPAAAVLSPAPARAVRTAALLLAALLALASWIVPAEAATYTLTASGSSTTTASSPRTLSVTYKNGTRPVTGASVKLQQKKDGEWLTVRTVTTSSTGKATTSVNPTTTRNYRFTTSRATSNTITVKVVPGSWTLTGSGSGHGVGMAQWGAYQLSRSGYSASQILGYYYAGTTTSTANNPRTSLKVQILRGSSSTARSTVSLSEGSWRLLDGSGATITSAGPGRTAVLGVSGSSVTVKVMQGSTVVRPTTAYDALTVEWTGTTYWSGTAGTVSVSGAPGTYRHGRLHATSIGGRLNVVNEVIINTEYLYGIDEMPSGWGASSNNGTAALQAQVIAARTYALRAKTAGLDASCDCHVYDDTRSQNYVGWRKEGGELGDLWKAAVDATVQDATSTVSVLRDPSAGFAETPYFASSGRVTSTLRGTADNEDVWPVAALSYLRHQPDTYSLAAPGNPYAAWTDSLTQSQAQSISGLNWVRSLAVSAWYPSGQVKTIKATSDTGSIRYVTRTAESWRTTPGVKGGWISAVAPRK